MSMIKRANKTKVDPRLMEEVLEAIADLPSEDRGFEGSTITVVKIVSELDLPKRQRMNLGLALNFRLMALARLTDSGGGGGWTLPGEEGCTFIHAELVRAAAEEPMIEVDGQVTFDPESFHRRLLGLAEMHGQA